MKTPPLYTKHPNIDEKIQDCRLQIDALIKQIGDVNPNNPNYIKNKLIKAGIHEDQLPESESTPQLTFS